MQLSTRGGTARSAAAEALRKVQQGAKRPLCQVRRVIVSLVLFAALAAAAYAGDPRPLDKAKVGEWVLEKSTASGFTSWTYMWISKVEGRRVTVMTQLLKDEKNAIAPGQPTLVDLDKPDGAPKDAPKPKTSEEEIVVKGRALKCTKTETETEIQGLGKMTSTVWSSPEIPIYGYAKMVSKDDHQKVVAEMETVDYGHEGAAEKPLK